MEFKPDWEQAVRRFEAWYAFEETDRPVMIVSAPKAPLEAPPPPADLLSRWTDAEYLIARHEAVFRSTHYAGESYPMLWPNLGPGIAGAYAGCEPVFDETTMWLEPVERPAGEISPAWDEGNPWWKVTLELTRAAAAAGEGRWVTAITDLGGVTDILAGMLHPDRLCIEMLEEPAEVMRLRDCLLDIWKRAYSALADITQGANGGTTGWLGTFSVHRTYPLQCDFCCMIGPEMFERFVLPELRDLCRWLDRPVYHLDGPGAVKHLDALLGIPELKAIQWVQGAGQAPTIEWVDLLKRILNAGKAVFAYASPAEVRPLLEALGARGVALSVGASSPEEADHLVRMSAEWSRS